MFKIFTFIENLSNFTKKHIWVVTEHIMIIYLN